MQVKIAKQHERHAYLSLPHHEVALRGSGLRWLLHGAIGAHSTSRLCLFTIRESSESARKNDVRFAHNAHMGVIVLDSQHC